MPQCQSVLSHVTWLKLVETVTKTKCVYIYYVVAELQLILLKLYH